MRVNLMNFGSATRIVYNSAHRPVVIEVGAVATDVDLDTRTLGLLQSAQNTDTLMIIDTDFVLSERMTKVVTLLRDIESGEYNDLLRLYGEVTTKEEARMRPSRVIMRAKLMKEAAKFCRMQSSGGMIHDDVDPKILEKEIQEQEGEKPPPVETPPPPPPPAATEKKRKHRRR